MQELTESNVDRRCPLKLKLCAFSVAECPLPVLFPPDEGDEAIGEGEEGTGDEGWAPSETLMRLFRISRLSCGPLRVPCPGLPPLSTESMGLRGTFRAGGVLILHCSIMLGESRGLRIIGGLTGSCLVRATCWLLTYLALSASRRSTALNLRAPGSTALRK